MMSLFGLDKYEYKYVNGNYLVTSKAGDLYKEALRINEDLVSDFPDSIDLKLSNRCSNGCPFCHENSVPGGKIFDLERTKKVLSQLPELPIEIAIGGGNILENCDEIRPLILWLKERGNLVRCTIRMSDVFKLTPAQRDFLKLFPALGISLGDEDFEAMCNKIDERGEDKFFIFSKPFDEILGELLDPKEKDKDKLKHFDYANAWYPKIVFHIIAGMFSIPYLDMLIGGSSTMTEHPILILGFKRFGRAKNMPLPGLIPETGEYLKRLIYKRRMEGCRKYTGRLNDGIRSFTSENKIVFDNLALEQLNIKDALLPQEWDALFMGEEGTHSMYVDAVEGMFAKSSTSTSRADWNEIGLIDYFKSL